MFQYAASFRLEKVQELKLNSLKMIVKTSENMKNVEFLRFEKFITGSTKVC